MIDAITFNQINTVKKVLLVDIMKYIIFETLILIAIL